ncbi:hypothetical protein ES703_07884 [subsurface metagenome]
MKNLREKDLRRISILILNYIILAILIIATVFTLSSDYIKPVRKNVIVIDETILEKQTPETKKSYEQLEEKSKYLDEPTFPHKSPFEIYIPILDVKSKVYEGEFSKDSELEKLVMLKELPTTGGGKISLFYPGEEGVCLIAGHHLKSGKLFGALEHIEKDDDVILTSSAPKVVLTYKVVDIIPYGSKYSPAEIFISREGELKLILLTCSYRIGRPKTRFLVICQFENVKIKNKKIF